MSDNLCIDITDCPIDLAVQISSLNDKNQGLSGALNSFVGIARNNNAKGCVHALHIEHYPEMTQKSLEKIILKTAKEYNIDYTAIVHRYGIVKPGEPIVFVGCLSRHRRASIAATKDIIDQLKTTAPFWKKEVGDFGEIWVEPDEASD